MWYFFDFSSRSRFPFELFLKQDKYFLKPIADSTLILWLLGVWSVLNVSSRFLGCYNKRRWLRSRMTSLQAMYYFGYAETFTIPSDRSGMVAICFAFFSLRAPAAIRAGSKMGCVELCNFHFCCASIFCQPMKKFEFFGATRATRQRHSKTSSTGDEDGCFIKRSNEEAFQVSIINIRYYQ